MNSDTKVCNKCGTTKPLSSFGKHKATRDGFRNACRECTNQATKERKARAHKWIKQLKLDSGCVDCGYAENPVALQFDHIGDDKEFTIADNLTCSTERLEAEVAKCEVVCANCHHIRTHRRLQNE